MIRSTVNSPDTHRDSVRAATAGAPPSRNRLHDDARVATTMAMPTHAMRMAAPGPGPGGPAAFAHISNTYMPANPAARLAHLARTETVNSHPAPITWVDPTHFTTSRCLKAHAWLSANALHVAQAQAIAGEPGSVPRQLPETAAATPGMHPGEAHPARRQVPGKLQIPDVSRRKAPGYFQHVAAKFLLDRKSGAAWNKNIDATLRKRGIDTCVRNISNYFRPREGITPEGEQFLQQPNSATEKLPASSRHGSGKSDFATEHAYQHSTAGRHNLEVIDAKYRDLHKKGLLIVDRYPSAVLLEEVNATNAAHVALPRSKSPPDSPLPSKTSSLG